MKKNYLLGIAALSAVVLLAGCGNKELTPAEFCEENGGAIQEDLCVFEDGSYCEPEAFSKGECAMGEIMFNVEPEVIEEEVVEPEVVEEEVVADETATEEVVEEAVAEEVTEEVAE